MDKVLEISEEQVETVEEQQVLELPVDLLGQVGGGTGFVPVG